MSAIRAAGAAISAEGVARHAQSVARAYVVHHGRKRGLALLGRIVGGARRARGLYAGEARRIAAHEYLALLEAEAALRRERAARLRQELAALEHAADADADLDMGRAGLGVVR
jgi:hypothetical protein